MAGRIPKQFIRDLVLRVDIVELIETRIKLKKRGANHQACCPFHQEKTPSFTVSADKQFYHCFGCGAHGNAIDFLTEYDNLNFVEAIEALAQFAGVPVQREQSDFYEEPTHSQDDYDCMQAIAEYFQQQLKASNNAIDYLKNRGVSGQIAKTFGLGFAPSGWDNLLKRFGQNAQKQQQLQRLGMIVPREDQGYYDRFRERIMFPIKDRQGRVIAFGGRVLSDGQPKYLNSPETPIYHKGDVLYGFYESKKSNRKLTRLMLVEGYLDVISLYQHDLNFAVAPLGTAATTSHINKLLRASSELIFCFDGDNAGINAAKKAMETLLPILPDDKYIRFLFLDEGSDPDSIVREHGRDHFLRLIDKAMPLMDYFFQTLEQDIPSFDLQGQAHIAKRAANYFNLMPNTLLKTILTQQLSERLHVDSHKLQQLMKLDNTTRTRRAPIRKRALTALAKTIALLLQFPQQLKQSEHFNQLFQLKIKDAELLLTIGEIINESKAVNTGLLLEELREHHAFASFTKLASEPFMLEGDAIIAEFDACVSRLAKQAIDTEIDQLMKKVAAKSITDLERKKLQELLTEQG